MTPEDKIAIRLIMVQAAAHTKPFDTAWSEVSEILSTSHARTEHLMAYLAACYPDDQYLQNLIKQIK